MSSREPTAEEVLAVARLAGRALYYRAVGRPDLAAECEAESRSLMRAPLWRFPAPAKAEGGKD